MRLNIDIKDQIANNAVQISDIPKKEEALKADRMELAERVRLHVNGEDGPKAVEIFEKIGELVEELPEGFELSGWGNHLSTGVKIGLERSLYYLDWGASRVIKGGGYNRVEIDAPELKKEIIEMQEREDLLNRERNGLHNEVVNFCNSVTTVKKLISVWPEVKELLPEEVTRPRAGLPMVQVADLNKVIGLPSEADNETD